MFGTTAVEMVKEFAEHTIFSKSALERQDAQEPARLMAKLLRTFKHPNAADASTNCGKSSTVNDQLVSDRVQK